MFLVYGTLRAADLDARLYENLGRLATPARTPALGTLAHSADLLPLLVFLGVLAIFAFRWDRRPHLLAALGVVAGSAVTTQLLKVVLAHPRVQPAVGHGIGPVSFPSGHATAAMSMAIALVLIVPRRHRWAAVILGAAYAIAVSVTVIILGWHYPSDVLAGTLVATGFGFLALAALRAGGYLKPSTRDRIRGTRALAGARGLPGAGRGRAERGGDLAGRDPDRLRAIPHRRNLRRLRSRGGLRDAVDGNLRRRRGVGRPLDPVLRVDLWHTFADLAGGGKTLLISSHVMEEAARCDSLLLMRDGDLIATMTPSALRASTRRGGARGRLSRPDRALRGRGRMSPRITAATAYRVLTQLRRDPRTVALLLAVPPFLITLLKYAFDGNPLAFDRVGAPLVGLFPFTTMFVVTSITMLRERTTGTLERLMTGLGVGFSLAGVSAASLAADEGMQSP